MIEIQNITKRFDTLTALDNVNANIEEGHVFGLIGTNGAGKSTLLRTICGIYAPENGQVLIDGEPIFENPKAKSKVFYISDSQYFFPGCTPMDMVMCLYYGIVYPWCSRLPGQDTCCYFWRNPLYTSINNQLTSPAN